MAATPTEKPTLYVCHGDDGGPKVHPCRRVQEALRGAGIEYDKVVAAHGSPIPFLRKGSRDELEAATGDEEAADAEARRRHGHLVVEADHRLGRAAALTHRAPLSGTPQKAPTRSSGRRAILPAMAATTPPPREAGANALAALAGVGLAATIALTLSTETITALHARGEPLIALGRLAGMVAAYSMLVLVLLVARLPVIERVAGHDQLVAWHRTLGPWPLYLVAGTARSSRSATHSRRRPGRCTSSGRC